MRCNRSHTPFPNFLVVIQACLLLGEFGTVFRGVWKEQQKKAIPVAVKTLKVYT